jgi:hypothetical protein
MADGNVVVPFFYTKAVEDPVATKEAGRPIYNDMEFVEYRFAGNRYLNLHFPAHEMHERVNGEDITHAMRWPDQYAQFKRDGVNEISGTPLEELTFLTNAERSELKALKIYTAEALSQIDGPTIKSLGGKGYRYKEQAEAYINQGAGAAGVAKLVGEMEAMRAEIEALRSGQTGSSGYTKEVIPHDMPADFDPRTDDELKAAIFEKHGQRPRGQPRRETLLQMLAQDAATEAAA